MKPTQAIKDKALELAALYTSVANGRELQWNRSEEARDDWGDPGNQWPTVNSNLSRWRVKPEPMTMWLASTNHLCLVIPEDAAARYREEGYTVSKWTEVLS